MVVCPGSGGWFRPLEPGLEPGRNQPLNHLVPGVVPTLQPTLEPLRQCAPLAEHAHDFTEEKPGGLPKKLCRELMGCIPFSLPARFRPRGCRCPRTTLLTKSPSICKRGSVPRAMCNGSRRNFLDGGTCSGPAGRSPPDSQRTECSALDCHRMRHNLLEGWACSGPAWRSPLPAVRVRTKSKRLRA